MAYLFGMQIMRVGRSRIRAINSANPDAPYVFVAFVMAAIGVTAIADPPPASDYRTPDGLLTAFVVAGAGLISVVRRWALPALIALFGLLLTQLALNYEVENVAFLISLVMVFLAASRVRTTLVPAVAALPAILLVALFVADEIEVSDLFVNVFIYGVAVVGGVLVKSRLNRIQQVETYAAELSDQRDTAALDAVRGERARIARELHDVVGHTLNLIVIQAGAAQRVKATNPSAAFDALKTIESTGRHALGDMDRMLGILRDDESNSISAELGPRPGLSRLASMLDEARAAGLNVQLNIVGTERKLPASIDLTAFRIVQESMTNVIKHAPGATVLVAIEFGAKSLIIEIKNSPPARLTLAGRAGGGRGIPGMKERVDLFGGTMLAEESADGGFLVRVSLPIDEES